MAVKQCTKDTKASHDRNFIRPKTLVERILLAYAAWIHKIVKGY